MKKNWLLITSLFLGSVLRLISLGNIPQGFTWDEAALGYNAYSILHTGRDEFGKFLPLIFKSFGDYKPGFYVYTAVPSIAIFGLNEFATRLPSALAGILAIYGIYLLVKKLTKHHLPSTIYDLPSLCALALALSPWHIHFSRGAWEANLFTTLLIFSLYYFVRFLEAEVSPFPSLILACLSLVTYQAGKMLTPLVFILLIALYWKTFFLKTKDTFSQKQNFFFLLPILFFGIWVYFGSVFGPAGNRLGRLSIFTYKPAFSETTKKIDNNNSISLSLFHNNTQLTAKLIASRYLYYFSPEVLFYEGTRVSEMGHLPRSGMLNHLEFIWLALGLVFLAKNSKENWTKVILGLALVSPLPASLTLAEFSTFRSLFFVVPLAIISGCGMYYLLNRSKLVFALVGTVYLLFTVYIFDLYFVHGKFVFPKEYLYGYRQAFQLINENPNSRVVFTDVLGQPYIYYLFYTKFNPSEYQKTNHFTDLGVDVGKVEQVGLAEFHQFGFGDISTYKNTIFVGMEGNIPNNTDFTNPVIDYYRSIKYPDGTEVFRVIKTKP